MLTGRFLTGTPPRLRGPKPWYRKRTYQLLIVVVVVVAAFLTDRYDRYTPSQKQSQLASLYQSVKNDLTFCNDGVTLAAKDWKALGAAPTPAAAARLASEAGEAEPNCTPVSNDGGVYNLANLEVPGELASLNQLSVAVYDLTEWAYPDAARALLDLKTLASHPDDSTSLAQLAQMTAAMSGEADKAAQIFDQAAASLGSKLSPLGLSAP